jgi:sortase B
VKYKKLEEDKIYSIVSGFNESDSNIISEYQDRFNNTDIVGEISISNSSFRLPFVKGDDNKFYLNHLLDKSYNKNGSIFLDYRNNLSDRKLILYGHNLSNDFNSFHILKNYLNESYFIDHSSIFIKTLNRNHEYKIFSVYVTSDDFRHVNLNFDDKGYSEHLNWLSSSSLYDTHVSVSFDDILVLQTCLDDDSFIIVCAKKID